MADMLSFKAMRRMKNRVSLQTSDSYITGLLLALSAGFQDAYTYIERNHVFSNAQTGNIVLMGQYIFAHNWQCALQYFLPVLAFAAGIYAAENIEHKYKFYSGIHWRRLIVLLEIITLLCVGFIPHRFDEIATMMVSFSCALQLQSFRKIGDNNYASTMCIGNLRQMVNAFSLYHWSKDRKYLLSAAGYSSVILVFGIGAGICVSFASAYGSRTIIGSCIILLAVFLVMKEEKVLT